MCLFFFILLLQQYLSIVAVRDNIITVATHAINFGKNLISNKILVALVLTNTSKYQLVLTQYIKLGVLHLSINEELLDI